MIWFADNLQVLAHNFFNQDSENGNIHQDALQEWYLSSQLKFLFLLWCCETRLCFLDMCLTQFYDTSHIWTVPPSYWWPGWQSRRCLLLGWITTLTLSPVVNLKLVTRNKAPLRTSVIDLHMTAFWWESPRGWIWWEVV